jgi:hypothetical protein
MLALYRSAAVGSLKFFTASSTDAHTASRCAESIIAISLSLNKEMAKENQPKGLMPFGFP